MSLLPFIAFVEYILRYEARKYYISIFLVEHSLLRRKTIVIFCVAEWHRYLLYTGATETYEICSILLWELFFHIYDLRWKIEMEDMSARSAHFQYKKHIFVNFGTYICRWTLQLSTRFLNLIVVKSADMFVFFNHIGTYDLGFYLATALENKLFWYF